MNTPTDDLRPSATVDEALERFVAAHNRRIHELEKQRDELAACLREAKDGFVLGRFTCAGTLSGKGVHDFALFMSRINAALLRQPVRERLDDKLAAERRGQEAQA